MSMLGSANQRGYILKHLLLVKERQEAEQRAVAQLAAAADLQARARRDAVFRVVRDTDQRKRAEGQDLVRQLSGQRQTVATTRPAFRYVKKLAEGGFGDLWLGYWEGSTTHVIVKFLRENADAMARRGFAREVRILRKGLPGFVRLISAESEGARPHYVMEYLKNGAVARWAGQLNRQQLRQIIGDMASSLAAMHAAGIAHGDIKPHNTLLGDDLHVRIADPIGCGWGCTVLFADNKGGTPGYWAPEIASGGTISNESDIWSFGATVHHLATGVAPRADSFAFEMQHPIFAEAPEIAEIVRACLQVNPDRRPSMKDIGALLNGGSWRATFERRQGNLRLLGGAGVLVLLLIALGGSGS